MSVQFNANTLDQIKELATQAYGHGSGKAGSGRIGMVGGHVVKFNTHYGELHSTSGSMADMRASCDALRTHLYNIARNAYGEDFSKGMQKILSKLGLDASGRMLPQKDLLSRSIVAKFVDQMKRDSADLKGAMGDVRGGATVKHTMFADVRARRLDDSANAVATEAANKALGAGGSLKDFPISLKHLQSAMYRMLSGRGTIAAVLGDEHFNKLDAQAKTCLESCIRELAFQNAELRLQCAQERFKEPVAETPLPGMMLTGSGRSLNYEEICALDRKKPSKQLVAEFSKLFQESDLCDRIVSREIKSMKHESVVQFMAEARDRFMEPLKAGFRQVGNPLVDEGKVNEKMAKLLGEETDGSVNTDFPHNSFRTQLEQRFNVLNECAEGVRLETRISHRMPQIVDDVKSGRAGGDLADAVRRVLVSLDPKQERLFQEFLVAKAASDSRKYGKGLDLNTADGIRGMLDRMVQDNSGNITECLEYLGKLVEAHDSNAATRLLEVMRDAPNFPSDLARMMNAIQRDNPDALRSQKSFAGELKSRLGLGGELSAEESADLEWTIARMGADLSKMLPDFFESAEKVKVGENTTLLDDIRKRASDAVDNAIAKDMLFAGCDTKAVKDDVVTAIGTRCRINGRFSVTEDDVKIALFSAICNWNFTSAREDNDPAFMFLKNKDVQQAEREVCAMDDTQLRAKIADFSKSLVDKLGSFRTNRDRAYGVARDKLVALGEKLGVKLAAGDIDMKVIDSKLGGNDISEMDSYEKVQEVVDKKIGVLTRFAEGLQASTKIPPKVKGAMFKWACAFGPGLPDGLAGMMESLMSAYGDLSKAVPGLLSQINYDSQVIEAMTKLKEATPKKEAETLKRLDREITAAQEDRNVQYQALTQAILNGLCNPIEQHLTDAQNEFGVDDLMPIVGVFGHAMADADDFGPLNQLAQFVKNDQDYGQWLGNARGSAAIKVPTYVGPLAEVV